MAVKRANNKEVKINNTNIIKFSGDGFPDLLSMEHVVSGAIVKLARGYLISKLYVGMSIGIILRVKHLQDHSVSRQLSKWLTA